MMPSFDVINYSLRANKSIQRCLVFEGVRKLAGALDLERILYVGFGSIWFTDFQMAHKDLNIQEMISIEADDIGFARACFNRPFRTVRMEKGYSSVVIPQLLDDEELNARPWLVWLDYDGHLDESAIDDLRVLIERAPQNSVVLSTFNAGGSRNYGPPKDRPERLRALLGAVVPDGLSRDACNDENLAGTLADYSLQLMESIAANVARPGGFVPAFRLLYRDSAVMATIGGVLPSKGALPALKQLVSSREWPGKVTDAIVTPPLTLKEAAVLQAALPRSRKLTRKALQKLGFDLQNEQLSSFERYYRYYPSFAEITV